MHLDIFLTIFTSRAVKAREVHPFSRPDAALYCDIHVIVVMFDLICL